jgi:hypothetical protein
MLWVTGSNGWRNFSTNPSPSSLWQKSPVASRAGRAHLRCRLTPQIAAVFLGFAPSIYARRAPAGLGPTFATGC